MNPRLRLALGAVVGAAALVALFSAAVHDDHRYGTGVRVTATVTPAPSANVIADDGASDAQHAVGWAVIQPNTAASRYWAQHGVGDEDLRYSCEAALRVQFVNGYNHSQVGQGHEPLWLAECGGIPGTERDSMLAAAVEWSATHRNGDG
jgi:hypothetical protein